MRLSAITTLVLALSVLLRPSETAAAAPYFEKMAEGAKAYSADDLDAAERLFTESAEASRDDGSAAALAQYNLGNVRLRQGNYEAANQSFASALSHERPAVRANAYYNRGLSLYRQAQALEEAQDLEQAIGSAGQALEMFENSIELDATKTDVKTNLELAWEYRETLLKKKEEQEQQQEQEQEQNQDQDQKQEQDQNEQNQDQDQNQDQSQNQSQNSDDPSQNPENQPQPEQNQSPEEESGNDPNQEPEPQPGEEGTPDEQPPEDSGEQQQPQDQTAGNQNQMTKEEALMLLDAMREQEANERSKFKIQYGTPAQNPIAKPY